MKKILLLIFAITATITNAQKIEAIEQKERLLVFENSDVKALQKRFETTEKNINNFKDEGCIRFSGKDASGDYDISMIVVTTPNTSKKHIDIVILVNHITNEKRVFAETNSLTYTSIKGKVSQIPIANSNARSVTSCWNQYKKGLANCPNCLSCINNCWKKNKKWQRISCAVTSCGSTCFSCVTSVYQFALCVFD